jgi:diguanylate cyclase (GGDEF)-like protein
MDGKGQGVDLLIIRKIVAVAILLGSAAGVLCAQAKPLTSLAAIHALSNAQAAGHIPVAFEATVTYYRDVDSDLFVQDGGDAVYVSYKPGAGFSAGDHVLIQGMTHESFRPIINAQSVTLLRHGIAPAPVHADFPQLNSAQLDCQRVKLRAVVRSADIFGTPPEIYLQTVMDGGYVDVAINSTDTTALKPLLDAEVEITGVATAKFDERMELAGSRIDVQKMDDVKVVHPAAIAIHSIPFTPMEEVFAGYRVTNYSSRVRVQGTLTYFQPGATLVLQDGVKSLWVRTLTNQHVTIGDLVEVTGFPELQNEYPTLGMAEVRDTGIRAPIVPLLVSWQQLVFGGNAFRLVTTEGRLVRQMREPALDEYVMESAGHVFSAVYRHPELESSVTSPPIARLLPGAKIRVTGIGMFYTPDPFHGPVASTILLRSDADIVILASPSLINNNNLILLSGVLIVLVLGAVARGWVLERRVRREMAVAASIERGRSLILEDINRTRPLNEIIGGIITLLSYRLKGTPCWCRLADGEVLGNPPAEVENSRLAMVQQEIPSHTGAALGTLFAATNSRNIRSQAPEALFSAAQLAALAIETRGLYSDLVRRSEFDLLTGIHNRFSLEKQLDRLIGGERREDARFGLIYIDLDDFKGVNDQYGHRIGDLYLQEAARRMSGQLRPEDMLARLGGDEFAALLRRVRTRADVAEIAERLEHCFDMPFVLDEATIRGTASVGTALYPEDGADRDSLLSSADASMYVGKNIRRMGIETSAG